MRRTVLVAIGGHSLVRSGEPVTIETQRAHLSTTCRELAAIVAAGWRLIVTHGNGPQVGAALRRAELASDESYPAPLDLCVADTQAEIGVLLQRALDEALAARLINWPAATIVSQVEVSETDPAFRDPRKPIGPFYSSTQAEARRRAGWTIVDEPPQGCRRVVPSPEPVAIVEESAIRTLVESGLIVIALGGGGIPVVRHGQRLEGVDAVIDKDLASALLAIRLDIDVFAMVTDVDRIYANFGRPDQYGLEDVTVAEMRRLSARGQFPPGTMGPKVEAALRFLAHGGSSAIVTSPDHLVAALEGHEYGTHIVRDVGRLRRHAHRLAS